MLDQTTTQLMGLIHDLQIYIHNIPCVITFVILQNNVVDSNYSMLLVRLWLKDTKVEHDWGNNMVIIQGNGTIETMATTKHLGSNVKQLEVLLCYDFYNNIT
jgi:hypothetical protein